MKRLDIRVQRIATQLQPVIDRDPFRWIDLPRCSPRRLQLRQEMPTIGLVRMEFDAMVAQPMFAQAAIHHVQRRRLLRDEQHRLAHAQAVRDHVGDRLTLARTRRSDDHEITTPAAARLAAVWDESDGSRQMISAGA